MAHSTVSSTAVTAAETTPEKRVQLQVHSSHKENNGLYPLGQKNSICENVVRQLSTLENNVTFKRATYHIVFLITIFTTPVQIVLDPLCGSCLQTHSILGKSSVVVFTLGHKLESTKAPLRRCTCPYFCSGITKGHTAHFTLQPGSFQSAPSNFPGKVAQAEDWNTGVT